MPQGLGPVHGEDAQPVPRSREARVDAAVLPIALESFFRHGVEGINVVDIARRAGVGRQSIYRRWPDRRALVLAAIDAAPVELPALSGSTTRDRLLQLLRSIDPARVAGRLAMVAARLATEGESDPEIARRCVERLVLPRRAQLRGELERGIARGELRADVDLDLLVEVVTAPTLLPHLARAGRPTAVDPAELIDLILRGARAE